MAAFDHNQAAPRNTSPPHRHSTVDDHRRRSQPETPLLSPRAGGVGLTLTAANHVVHLERWWNPAVEDQCTGRTLRIGQLRPVMVHVVQAVCPGRRSFDQNLHALLLRKRELVRDTLGSGEVSEDESVALLRETISSVKLAPTIHHRPRVVTATTAYLAASSSHQSVASAVPPRRLPCRSTSCTSSAS
jgi:hypothetical protein